MNEYFRLELRKHSKELFGVILTLLLVLFFSSGGYTIATGYSFRSALWGVCAFLILGGVPLTALVFGGSFGSGLVRTGDRVSEELLPISPAAKLFSSYFASLLFFVLTGLVFYLMLLLTQTPTLILDAFDFDRIRILLLPLHCYAFIFAYWLKQPILGSGLSLIFTGLQYFFLFLFPSNPSLFESFPFLTVVVILLFQLAILRPLACKVERSGRTGILTGLLLLIPLILSSFAPYGLLLLGLIGPNFKPAFMPYQ